MRFLLPILALTLLLSCNQGDPNDSNKPEINRVILICLDTLRYDHVNIDVTPNIHALVEESLNFTNCRATASWTLPSIASVFTGKLPSRAGTLVRTDILPVDQITIAEILNEDGWNTYSYVANSVISPDRHFDQGFDIFEYHQGATAKVLLEMALEKLLEDAYSKTFCYIHLIEPHRPYMPLEEFRVRFAQGSGRFAEKFNRGAELLDGSLTITDEELQQIHGLYDAECSWADAEIGKLIDTLKAYGLWDTTAMIFFADHGEEFNEHGEWFHGNNLYEETVHVPFSVKFPQTEPAVIDDLTSLRAVGKHIFEGIGIDVPPEFKDDNTFYMEGVDRGEELKGIITTDLWKLVYGTKSETLELYDLTVDPFERNNLNDQKKEKAERLAETLFELYENTPETGSGKSELTPEMEEQLRAIGYLN